MHADLLDAKHSDDRFRASLHLGSDEEMGVVADDLLKVYGHDLRLDCDLARRWGPGVQPVDLRLVSRFVRADALWRGRSWSSS